MVARLEWERKIFYTENAKIQRSQRRKSKFIARIKRETMAKRFSSPKSLGATQFLALSASAGRLGMTVVGSAGRCWR
jgi:hypothetical protein